MQIAPEFNQNDTAEHEAIWLWEDGQIPEPLQTLTHNTYIVAQTLLKHLNELNDALGHAKRDKEQNQLEIDALISEFGIFYSTRRTDFGRVGIDGNRHQRRKRTTTCQMD